MNDNNMDEKEETEEESGEALETVNKAAMEVGYGLWVIISIAFSVGIAVVIYATYAFIFPLILNLIKDIIVAFKTTDMFEHYAAIYYSIMLVGAIIVFGPYIFRVQRNMIATVINLFILIFMRKRTPEMKRQAASDMIKLMREIFTMTLLNRH